MLHREDLHTDCRQFRWDRPCEPHKRSGVTCPTCTQYEPVHTQILVVKLAATGDVLRTTALLPAIHAKWPQAKVAWLTAPSAKDLFPGNRWVSEVLPSNDPITQARLAVQEFDVVLCPDADPQAAVLAAAAKGRTRRGFTMDRDGHVVPLGAGAEHWLRMGLSDAKKRANRETYQSLVAKVLDLDPSAVSTPVLEPAAADHEAAAGWRARLNFSGRLVGLNTGAGGRWLYKQWTLSHQQEFLRQCAAAGHGVLLLGGPEERERHATLMASAKGLPVFDAGTDNSYRRFAALMDLVDVLVTGDTFAMHVGSARQKPVIALFGPTSSAEIELYGRGEKIVPAGLECLCCYLPSCDRKPYCQELILPERVLEAVQRWIGMRCDVLRRT